jgi:hypothetical protein
MTEEHRVVPSHEPRKGMGVLDASTLFGDLEIQRCKDKGLTTICHYQTRNMGRDGTVKSLSSARLGAVSVMLNWAYHRYHQETLDDSLP